MQAVFAADESGSNLRAHAMKRQPSLLLEVAAPGTRAQPAPRHAPSSFSPASAMRPAALWLCVRLPMLALEVYARAVPAMSASMVAMGAGRERRVLVCNAAARALGVLPGMRIGAAHALGALQVLAQDVDAEARALTALALWAGQFTPVVSIVQREALLLEIAGSVKLFGGLEALTASVREGIAALGYSVETAVAPTATAALLLARVERGATIAAPGYLTSALARLPLAVLGLAPKTLEALRGMGLVRIGDLLRLPRAGLARRVSPALIDLLDRALGRVPDPYPRFVPAPRFESMVELPSALTAAAPLVFLAQRMLLELTGFLRARCAGTQQLRWDLLAEEQRGMRISGTAAGGACDLRDTGWVPGAMERLAGTAAGRACDGSGTVVDLRLVTPTRDPEHLLLLTRERFERLVLHAPVQALQLCVEDLTPLEGESGTLPRMASTGQRGDVMRLVERLRSQLGSAAVRGLATCADHRPERASVQGAPGEQGRSCTCERRRPLSLLPVPRRLSVRAGRPEHHGPLTLEQGPERIESGWWEEAGAVARDYFLARNPAGERYWIYRDLATPSSWFLHGVFD